MKYYNKDTSYNIYFDNNDAPTFERGDNFKIFDNSVKKEKIIE